MFVRVPPPLAVAADLAASFSIGCVIRRSIFENENGLIQFFSFSTLLRVYTPLKGIASAVFSLDGRNRSQIDRKKRPRRQLSSQKKSPKCGETQMLKPLISQHCIPTILDSQHVITSKTHENFLLCKNKNGPYEYYIAE